MARVRAAEQSAPSTPSSGMGILWPDSIARQWFTKDSAGRAWGRSHNAAVASQGAGFSSDTYVTDSDILIPSFGVQAKTVFRWTLVITKTAAGIAAPVYSIRIGSGRSTSDTAHVQITGPAQTAAVDVGFLTIMATNRTVSASGSIKGTAGWIHNASVAGFCNNEAGAVDATSSTADNSALAGLYIGLSINAGASAAWTITQVFAEAIW